MTIDTHPIGSDAQALHPEAANSNAMAAAWAGAVDMRVNHSELAKNVKSDDSIKGDHLTITEAPYGLRPAQPPEQRPSDHNPPNQPPDKQPPGPNPPMPPDKVPPNLPPAVQPGQPNS